MRRSSIPTHIFVKSAMSCAVPMNWLTTRPIPSKTTLSARSSSAPNRMDSWCAPRRDTFHDRSRPCSAGELGDRYTTKSLNPKDTKEPQKDSSVFLRVLCGYSLLVRSFTPKSADAPGNSRTFFPEESHGLRLCSCSRRDVTPDLAFRGTFEESSSRLQPCAEAGSIPFWNP